MDDDWKYDEYFFLNVITLNSVTKFWSNFFFEKYDVFYFSPIWTIKTQTITDASILPSSPPGTLENKIQ